MTSRDVGPTDICHPKGWWQWQSVVRACCRGSALAVTWQQMHRSDSGGERDGEGGQHLLGPEQIAKLSRLASSAQILPSFPVVCEPDLAQHCCHFRDHGADGHSDSTPESLPDDSRIRSRQPRSNT